MIAIRRAVEAAFLKRDSLVEIALDQRATADAALLVSGVALIGYVWDLVEGARFSWRELLPVLINSILIWIIIAGLTLVASRVLWKTETPMPTVMRLQGFCHLPLVLINLGGPFAWFGYTWFLVVLGVATAEALEIVYWRAALTLMVSLPAFLLITLLWGARLF